MKPSKLPPGRRRRLPPGGVLLLAAFALVMAGLTAAAQTRHRKPYVPQYTLTAGEATPVGSLLAATPVLGSGWCDANGNLYLRILPSYLDRYIFAAPVTEFSTDGEKKTVFSPAATPGWGQGEFSDYTVGQDGMVYLLAQRPTPKHKVETAILGFDQDGSHALTAPLELPVTGYDHIAVFSTGQFLVIGAKKAQPPPPRIPGTPVSPKDLSKHHEPDVEPIGFVVERDGRLIKQVVLPADPLSVDHGKANGAPLVLNAFEAQGRATLVAGDDGIVYAMFPTSPPFVFAISSSGEIVHSFAVELPSPAYSAVGMKWAEGLGGLLLESAEIKNHGFIRSQTVLSVIDPTTGQRVADYHAGPGLGTLPACFNQGRIYFLGSSKRKLVIREAEIH